MLWFLLYPLRRTSQPPQLPVRQYIYRAFYRHGKTTATHWLIAMLVSVAVGVILSYPAVFLSENPTAGFTSLPHHVWTSAEPFDGAAGSQADIELRQIWIHGGYMQALQSDVLADALMLQNELLNADSSELLGQAGKIPVGELAWGFHSPLMYWNNSLESVLADPDILDTINQQAYRVSPFHFTLRPPSVFAGKLFAKSSLLAADALVLTLFSTSRDGINGAETRWDRRMAALAQSNRGNWTLYPENGLTTKSQDYEFSFQPLSLWENVALAFAYGCMVLYVIISLRRLKAFHSRFGLVVTAITQVGFLFELSFAEAKGS